MTEIRADEKGVVWLGGDEERVVVIHSEKSRHCPSGTGSGGVDREGQRRGL